MLLLKHIRKGRNDPGLALDLKTECMLHAHPLELVFTLFFYKNSLYNNHYAQKTLKIKNFLKLIPLWLLKKKFVKSQ